MFVVSHPLTLIFLLGILVERILTTETVNIKSLENSHAYVTYAYRGNTLGPHSFERGGMLRWIYRL